MVDSKIKGYLDRCIRHWRERLQAAEEKEKEDNGYDRNGDGVLKAKCYIDAFQSMRVTIFGESLRSEND